MDTENPTNNAQPDAVSTQAAGGNEAASTQDTSEVASLSLKEINEITGKQYKSKESALKSIRDMSKQAGKVADLEGQLTATLTKSEIEAQTSARIAELETDNFFARNPQHEANRDLLTELAKANGVSVKEAVELEVYQKILERMTPAGATQKRTVMDSSTRQAAPAGGAFDPKGKTPDELAKHVADAYFTS